jgi:hypothetical protein
MTRQGTIAGILGAIIVGAAMTAAGATWTGGLLVGYGGGTTGQLQGAVSDFAEGFPLSARLALGFTSIDPGNPELARRTFINDATNGTPEESGRVLDFRFDLVRPWRQDGGASWSLFGGPRLARYKGTFDYVGGNEKFDVTGSHWGVGGGLEALFPMGPRAALTLAGGLDYYFRAPLSGHDTTYAPDGENVNGRDGYSFADADEAINQPRLEPRLMIGVTRRFGR